MYGVLDFYRGRARGRHQAGHRHGGVLRHRRAAFDRPRRAEHDIFHLTLLAESNAGYRNLIKLSSAAYLDGLLLQAARSTSSCSSATARASIAHERLPRQRRCQRARSRDDDAGGARARGALPGRPRARQLLHRAPGPRPRRAAPGEPGAAATSRASSSAPLLATNDSHYTHRDDAEAHDALLCVQTGHARATTRTACKFDGEEFYLKTAAEMRHLFARLRGGVRQHAAGSPSGPTSRSSSATPCSRRSRRPRATTRTRYLRELTLEGARERYGDAARRRTSRSGSSTSSASSRRWGSPRTSSSSGTSSATRASAGSGSVPGGGARPGRASRTACSIVDIDPIRYDLLFERFLNPGRKQMPDIDMDFDSRYRGEMIRYAAERYGDDHVAQIITFSTIKARAAVRDAARVLGYPYVVGDKIAKLMPPLIMGRDTPLAACLEPQPKHEDGYKMAAELRELYAADPDAKRVDRRRARASRACAARTASTRPRSSSPASRSPSTSRSSASPRPAASWPTAPDRHAVRDARRRGPRAPQDGLPRPAQPRRRSRSRSTSSRRRPGTRPDIDNVAARRREDVRDAPAGRHRSACSSSKAGRCAALLRSLAPTAFEDIAALVALYRPGPMAQNWHNEYAEPQERRGSRSRTRTPTSRRSSRPRTG